jgi:very-short-patch-repair endonuclease
VWRLLPPPATPEVTVAGRRTRRRPDLTVHSVAALDPADVAHRAGLAITAPARTLLDLATVVPPDTLARAIAEAQVLRLVAAKDLRAAIARAPGHRGARACTRMLDDDRAAPTRNTLERTMLALVRSAGLPRPAVNAPVGGFEIDFAWPGHRLLVETDGWSAHGHRRAFEADRARDAELQAGGWTVVRFTWRQLSEQPVLVASRLAQLLARSAPAPAP